MRGIFVIVAVGLALAGCAGTKVALYDGEEECFDTATQKKVQCPTGSVAVLNDEAGGDIALIDQAFSRGSAKATRASVKNVKPDRLNRKYGRLFETMPRPPMKVILYFKNETELVDESRPLIASLFNEIATRPGADVEIVGHTDSLDDKIANDKLSRDRAEKVVALLAVEGLDSRRVAVSTAGRGEREPINNIGLDETFSPQNRRVEVFVK